MGWYAVRKSKPVTGQELELEHEGLPRREVREDGGEGALLFSESEDTEEESEARPNLFLPSDNLD